MIAIQGNHIRITARASTVRVRTRASDVERVIERACAIDLSHSTFYRDTSAQARDLACLCARVVVAGKVRALAPSAYDATCASGARAVRYVASKAVRDVTCNDVNADVREILEGNLRRVARDVGGNARWRTTFGDAQRELARLYVANETFDVVDVDGFGGANFTDAALRCVRFGGLFVAANTDGRALCGRNPTRLSVGFGNAVVAPSRPGVNEIALRAFIADVVSRGAALKLDVKPMFSLYSSSGPVFRGAFRVDALRGNFRSAFALDERSLVGYVGYCDACGNTSVMEDPLGSVFHHRGVAGGACERCGIGAALVVSGPIWLGSLHDVDVARAMRDDARALGWLDDSSARKIKGQMSLGDVLDAFVDEANPRLGRVCHHFRTDELARAKIGRASRVPPRDALITALRARGFAAARSHVDPRGVKTDASFADVVNACGEFV